MTEATPQFDVAIIGSGASGVNAAFELVEQGFKVAMVDVGLRPTGATLALDQPGTGMPYQHLRDESSPEQQADLFWGTSREQIRSADLASDNKLPPSRKYVLAGADQLAPYHSSDFVLNQSFAAGGLAEGWGAGAVPFPVEDLDGTGLDYAQLLSAYETVAKRIGVSGNNQDALSQRLGEAPWLQSPLSLDPSANELLKRFHRNQAQFQDQGFSLGQSHLAIASTDASELVGARGTHRYDQMEYWVNTDGSVFRPHYMLDALKLRENFTYFDQTLALSFASQEQSVTVNLQRVDSSTQQVIPGSEHQLNARHLMLAAGTLETGRLAAVGLGLPDARLPVLSNPYRYVPCLNTNGLFNGGAQQGKKDAQRFELSQLGALYAPQGLGKTKVYCSFFSYRAMLTSKLLREAPLPVRRGRQILQAMLPHLNIVTLLHDDRVDLDHKFATLGQNQRLQITYKESEQEAQDHQRLDRQTLGHFRKLGLWALKKVVRQPGSSIHYAGSLPMAQHGTIAGQPKLDPRLTTTAEHRLRGAGHDNVWVIDGASLPLQSAVPPTFTHMAFALRAARVLSESLRAGGSSR